MSTPRAIPNHIPPELVVDFDFYGGAEVISDPYKGLAKFHDGPDIFYTPHNEGHWVLTRAKDAREVLADHTRFSADLHYNPRWDENGPRLIPAQVDPPIHTAYRRILTRLMSPTAVAKLEDEIRSLSREVIEKVRVRGGCEFFSEVAQPFPTVIFLRWAKLPESDRAKLAAMADKTTHDSEPGGQAAGLQQLGDYVQAVINDRRARPGDDLISQLVAAEIDGKPAPDRELLQLILNVVLGGIDTVVSGLSFIIGYLARNPDQYRGLVANPEQIKPALEELMRVHGVACMERCVTDDLEFRGIHFKKFDRIVVIPALFGIDPHEIDDPLKVDFNRPRSPHMLFGAGPHHCVGAPLARLELKVFLEEWTRAIPEFALSPGTRIDSVGGFVFQPRHVHLEWNPAKTRSVRS